MLERTLGSTIPVDLAANVACRGAGAAVPVPRHREVEREGSGIVAGCGQIIKQVLLGLIVGAVARLDAGEVLIVYCRSTELSRGCPAISVKVAQIANEILLAECSVAYAVQTVYLDSERVCLLQDSQEISVALTCRIFSRIFHSALDVGKEDACDFPSRDCAGGPQVGTSLCRIPRVVEAGGIVAVLVRRVHAAAVRR